MAGNDESDRTIPVSMSAIAGSDRSASALLAGRYELLGMLGVGGMGAVYRARDLELGETVALKMLNSELARAPGMLERFREEVRLARRVTHPNIARIFDIGTTGDDWFLTMELVDGESLGLVLEREGAISVARTVAVASQTCSGLAAAHRAGIVHRDLKPDNILLRRDGHAVVADFGIARALAGRGDEDGTISGTPAYMAPEQVLGSGEIDARADVYALGVTMYECLTGRLPFTGDSAIAVAKARLDAAAPDPRFAVPGLPAAMAEIVMRCTALAKEDRYPSLDAVAADLARVGATDTAAEESPHKVTRYTRFDRTVAVLPVSNAGSADDDYLAEALTDDLAELLSGMGGVRVRRLDAVQRRAAQVRDGERDSRAIGRELGVQAIVEGAVRREGDSVQVTLSLVTVDDGFRLWSMSSERHAQDFFAFGDEAAAAIAQALTASDAPEPRRVDVPSEAMELYLQGRHLLMHGWVGLSQEACNLLERAHEAAPADARIAAWYGRALVRRYSYGEQGNARKAETVLEKLPDDAEAMLGLAVLHFQRGENVAGARRLVKCIERAPFLPGAVDWMGRVLLEVGPIEEGIVTLRRAYELEPLLGDIPTYVARGLALLGDWPAAVEVLLSAAVDPDQAPTLWMDAIRFAAWYGDRDRADIFAARFAALANPGERVTKIVSGFYDVLRARTAAPLVAILTTDVRVPRTRASFAQYRTEALAITGDVDAALASLADADGHGLFDASWIDRCPALERIRRESGFGAIAARVRGRADSVREVLAGE